MIKLLKPTLNKKLPSVLLSCFDNDSKDSFVIKTIKISERIIC